MHRGSPSRHPGRRRRWPPSPLAMRVLGPAALPGVELARGRAQAAGAVVVGGKTVRRPARRGADGRRAATRARSGPATTRSSGGSGGSPIRARRCSRSTRCSCRGPARAARRAVSRRCRSPAARRSSRGGVLDDPVRPATPSGRGPLAALERASRPGAHALAALTHVEPELTTAAAEAAVAEARALVDEPVALDVQGRGRRRASAGSSSRGSSASARRRRALPPVSFDPRRVAKAVEPLLAPWRRRAVNARFVVDGKRVRIAPRAPASRRRQVGRRLDRRAAASSSIRRASLRLKQIRADLTTRLRRRSSGIREQISTFTTDMGTSSSNRIHNVQLMADYIDGTIDPARRVILVQRPRRPADGRSAASARAR